MAVVVSSWSQPTVNTRNKLVEKVARQFGMDTSTSTDFTSLCLDALDDTVNDMNSNVYEYNRITETSITLTADTQSYTLSSNFYKEAIAYLNETTPSEDKSPMTYMTWSSFKTSYPDNTETGTPYIYSLYNFEREGKVYLWPVPDSSAASDYTLTVEYYRRIPLVSGVSKGSSIDVPREVESPLVYGAQKRVAALLDEWQAVKNLAALEAEALDRLKKIDRTHPDAKLRFRVGPPPVRKPGNTGTIWIKA